MDGISRSRGWDKKIPHGVLPVEQLVLSDKWARKCCSFLHKTCVLCPGSYMSAHVLLKLSNELRQSDNMQGLLPRNEFNNSIIHELE